MENFGRQLKKNSLFDIIVALRNKEVKMLLDINEMSPHDQEFYLIANFLTHMTEKLSI